MRKALRGGSFTTFVVALVAAASLTGPLAERAGAGPVEEALLLTLTNAVRASVGAPPLVIDPALTSIAQSWSNAMAAAGNISHNPNLKDQLPAGWSRMAENVGVGPSIAAVQDALVASAAHYANMTNPLYDHVGLAVTWSGLEVFVTEDFTRQAGGPVVTSPPPPPSSVVASVPATPPVTTRKPAVTTTSTPTTIVRPPAAAASTVGPVQPVLARTGPPSQWITMVFELLRDLDGTAS